MIGKLFEYRTSVPSILLALVALYIGAVAFEAAPVWSGRWWSGVVLAIAFGLHACLGARAPDPPAADTYTSIPCPPAGLVTFDDGMVAPYEHVGTLVRPCAGCGLAVQPVATSECRYTWPDDCPECGRAVVAEAEGSEE